MKQYWRADKWRFWFNNAQIGQLVAQYNDLYILQLCYLFLSHVPSKFTSANHPRSNQAPTERPLFRSFLVIFFARHDQNRTQTFFFGVNNSFNRFWSKWNQQQLFIRQNRSNMTSRIEKELMHLTNMNYQNQNSKWPLASTFWVDFMLNHDLTVRFPGPEDRPH